MLYAVCLLFSLPSAVDGWSQPHPLRQLVWWKLNQLLAIGHMEGVDTIVEFNLQLDRRKHSVEIRQRYINVHTYM